MTPQVLESTRRSISLLAATWHEEPLRIHSSSLAEDGTFEWHPAFAAWISGNRRNSDQRARLTASMRILRQYSIREYEVAYRVIVNGEPLERTTEWLNERAIRNGKPERYTLHDTRVIICSAVDKILAWL